MVGCGVRLLVFGCAPVDAAGAPRSALTTLATALRSRGHDVAQIWHAPRWASALPLGEHADGSAVLRRVPAPAELDPCLVAAAFAGVARAALRDVVRASSPDAVVLHADDAPVLAADPPHPLLLVVDDAAAAHAATPAGLAQLEAWAATGRAAVEAWRATPPAAPARRLRLEAAPRP